MDFCRYSSSASVNMLWLELIHLMNMCFICILWAKSFVLSYLLTISMYLCLIVHWGIVIIVWQFLLWLLNWCAHAWADYPIIHPLLCVLGCPSTVGTADVFFSLLRFAFCEPHHFAFCPTLDCSDLLLMVVFECLFLFTLIFIYERYELTSIK